MSLKDIGFRSNFKLDWQSTSTNYRAFDVLVNFKTLQTQVATNQWLLSINSDLILRYGN